MSISRIALAVFTLMLPGVPGLARAAEEPPPPEPPPPETPEEVINVISNLAPWLFGLLLVLAVLFLVIAAYAYLTAGEDAEKTNTARRMILYTVIAIVAAAFARVIPALIQEVTGITPNTPGNQIRVAPIAGRITNWLFGLLLALAALFVIYAGFLLLVSRGSEEEVTKAKRFVLYAVVAVVVAALAKVIVAIVKQLLGV